MKFQLSFIFGYCIAADPKSGNLKFYFYLSFKLEGEAKLDIPLNIGSISGELILVKGTFFLKG